MDRKHKILVIGTGSIGERHLRCLQTTGRCEMAFCEPMDSRRAEVAERYGIHSDLAFENLDSALASTTFDAAVVAAPAPDPAPAPAPVAAPAAVPSAHGDDDWDLEEAPSAPAQASSNGNAAKDLWQDF